jgi:hypothetical protein
VTAVGMALTGPIFTSVCQHPFSIKNDVFQMINGIYVEELSKGDEVMPEKYTEEETVIKISDLQRLKVL